MTVNNLAAVARGYLTDEDYVAVEAALGEAVERAKDMEDEVERLRAALADLVRLKDGPRDDAYRAAKDAAWDAARSALQSDETEATDAV